MIKVRSGAARANHSNRFHRAHRRRAKAPIVAAPRAMAADPAANMPKAGMTA
jgi:hypothetical protein